MEVSLGSHRAISQNIGFVSMEIIEHAFGCINSDVPKGHSPQRYIRCPLNQLYYLYLPTPAIYNRVICSSNPTLLLYLHVNGKYYGWIRFTVWERELTTLRSAIILGHFMIRLNTNSATRTAKASAIHNNFIAYLTV